ncbi:hypothetical protein [Pseudomonas sp. GXZC]|uniref:hypothetical protein n=1 Tax=Pseudomonas sp. GXZC TaxID=3003351 RepID=UPI0022AA7617|nr:hypothetical protein [Pseudomonas sp. GXZC]WAT32097.1 hypothetical protein OZ428_34110 [Pseudomonas sp. GXZC]
MARAKRSLKRRQFRFSLDPMDPVEGEALRLIDKIAEEAKELFEEISDDEADRYAFKRVLLGLLKERPVELQMHPRSVHEDLPAPAAATPAAGPSHAPAAATPTPVREAPIAPKAADVSPTALPQALEDDKPRADGPVETPRSIETASKQPSWQEQLIGSAPPAEKGVRHPMASSLAWSESKSKGSDT